MPDVLSKDLGLARLRLLRIAELLADEADRLGADSVALVAGQLALAILEGGEDELAVMVVAMVKESL